MKTTFVTPAPNQHGGMRPVATHAEHLQRRGHNVEVVARSGPPGPFGKALRGFLSGSTFE